MSGFDEEHILNQLWPRKATMIRKVKDAQKKYDAYGHMVQLGKVFLLMQASIAISKLIVKEKKALKRFEQQKLLKDIKKDD